MNNKLLVILLMVGNSFLAHANNPFNDYLLGAQTDVYDIELGNTSIPEMNVRTHARKINLTKKGIE